MSDGFVQAVQPTVHEGVQSVPTRNISFFQRAGAIALRMATSKGSHA